jgi:hypothetical protein
MHSAGSEEQGIYGLVAEFSDAESLVKAAEQVCQGGYTRTDTYTPYPVEEVMDALGKQPSKLPWIIFAGGFSGGVGGFLFMCWCAGIDYAQNIGGRPLFSWPAFMPITFECTVLCSAFCAVFGMILLNGLPMPYHPLFNVEQFAKASKNAFFLGIEAGDPRFDLEKTKAFLQGLQPRGVYEVEC